MVESKSSTRTAGSLLALMLVVALAATGCIRSIVRVTSQPSDARVTVNYVERGRTPIEIPILWYWYYKIQVEKDNFELIEADERFYAPPWAVPPFDLLAEALPIPIKNTYHRHYVLKPKQGD
jgi:hypothetical protein